MSEQPCDDLTNLGIVLLWIAALAAGCGLIIYLVWRM
jgi:hypothetical protein